MKILVIHQYFLFQEGGGGSRFNELTRFWSEAGHEVTVVAGQVEHGTMKRPERYVGHWVRSETVGAVTVHRCYVPEVYGRGFIGRMIGFFVFMLSAVWAGALHAGSAEVVVATSPPLIVAVPGILLSWLKRCPLVFEVRDLWPESAIVMGVLSEGSLLARLLYLLERAVYRLAQKIVVLTPAFGTDIVSRGLAPHEKIELIPNGADLDLFEPGPRLNPVRERYGWGDRFVVLYAGAHGLANHLVQFLEAAELLRQDKGILLVTVGDGPERQPLVEEARRRGLENFQALGPVPKREMPEILQAIDVGAAILKKADTFRTVYPNKVFDYMACQKPTLLAIDGVARELVVDSARSGVFVEPENPAEMAARIRELASRPDWCAEMAANGREFVQANYSRASLAAKYLRLLGTLTSRPGTGPAESSGACPPFRAP
ncbi:MAG: glycosyltransferase family 4 protein [Candidatus Wallbacteria bacterium]|nr:glycosyltransferase family 4 protein [Candidatus Wallbacteria bacterium]